MISLCTESSHINPLLGLGLLLSLPPMSYCLFFLCVYHSICCCLFLCIFPVSIFLCLCLHSPYIKAIPLYFMVNFARHVHICNCLPLHPEISPLTSAGGKCCPGQKMSGSNRKVMKVVLQMVGCNVQYVFVPQERLRQWVFCWNREPFPGQQGSIHTLLTFTSLMSTLKAQEVKCV